MMRRFGIIKNIRFNSTINVDKSTKGIYDNVLEQLREGLKISIKQKLTFEKTAIRGIMSEMKNLQIDNHGTIINKFQIVDHFNKLIKQREETAKEYLSPNQPERFKELAENELKEIEIIKKYLALLPVANDEDIKEKLRVIIENDKITDKRKLFSKIPWNKINEEWNASRSTVSEVINKMDL